MPENGTEQFRDAKAQSKSMLAGATVEEAFELGFWNGRNAGIESGLESLARAIGEQNNELADKSVNFAVTSERVKW